MTITDSELKDQAADAAYDALDNAYIKAKDGYTNLGSDGKLTVSIQVGYNGEYASVEYQLSADRPDGPWARAELVHEESGGEFDDGDRPDVDLMVLAIDNVLHTNGITRG